MVCSNCGTENEAGAKFCIECAAGLAPTCPTCGTVNLAAAKFCRECGTGLTPAGLAVQRPAANASAAHPIDAAIAERRLVSVLFADLVGFTPFAEERDAEDVRETLSRYFELASDVVRRYGGTVEKFIGDAVMAVWGAPTAQEDDAERAVRAALDLVEAVRTLGPGIDARAGVLTGEAAVTIGAANQGMVAGDLVNTASRLQAVAPAGTVLVGEVTHRAAAGAIAFERGDDQILKGKATPVPSWRALRVIAQRGGHGRSDLPEPPFVGRTAELGVLRDAVTATGREQRPRLVSVTGPPGIGKSRLAWELEKYIDGIAEPVYWHRGRSPAYGDGIAFWALGEMVRRRATLAEADSDAATRAQISAVVREHVPDDADRLLVEPALLTLLGVEPPPAGGRDVLFAGWRIFFERIATKGTTILLFEDLHWADNGLLDFIDHLLDWSRGVPLLVVTLARPELFDRRPDWGAGRRSYTAMGLEALPDEAMRELLDGFAPGLPPALVETILGRADGIPLYAVETVRALVADGRLDLRDGAYRPTADLGELSIPETLRSLIAARLDGLDPGDRSLLQDASVLGQTFTRGALAALAGRTEDELDPRLRVLVRREFLELEADRRSPERGQYRFVQSLIREVAYATMSRRDRHSRHLAAARYFEALGDEELAGALAVHYLAAHQTAADGPEQGASAAQARVALRNAAARAAGLGGNDSAVGFLRQAIAITNDPSERGELELAAGTSATAAGRYDDADALARSAIADFMSAGASSRAAQATARLGAIAMEGGHLTRARELLVEAVEGLPDGAPPDVRAPLLASLSRIEMRLTNAQAAIAAANEALALAEPNDLEEVVAEAMNNWGSSLGQIGRWREAEAILQGAVDVAHRGGFIHSELRARSNLAATVFYDDPSRAGRLYETNLEACLRFGNRTLAVWITGLVVHNARYEGRNWNGALAIAERGLAECRAESDRARILAARGLIVASRGMPSDEELEVVGEVAGPGEDPSAAADLAALTGTRSLVEGDLQRAVESFVEAARFRTLAGLYLDEALHAALWLGDPVQARSILARLDADGRAALRFPAVNRRSGHAGVLALEGRVAESLELFASAWATMRELSLDFVFARSVLDALHVLGPDHERVAAAGEEARAIFERLEARPYVARLDAATTRRRTAIAASPA